MSSVSSEETDGVARSGTLSWLDPETAVLSRSHIYVVWDIWCVVGIFSKTGVSCVIDIEDRVVRINIVIAVLVVWVV